MEKTEKKLVGNKQEGESSTDLFLKWGNKKRLRCVRVKDSGGDNTGDPSFAVSGRRRIRRQINSPFVLFSSDNNNNDITEPNFPTPSSSTRLTRNSEVTTSNRKSSPEKDEKFYPTRNFTAAGVVEKSKISGVDGGGMGDENCNKSKHVWPKLYIALTSKEKEEDFMAMKGCKPSHRPKKRAKIIQRTILLVSPGAWLSDMCQERYEVREKKSTKKKPTGLKAMGSMESDSE